MISRIRSFVTLLILLGCMGTVAAHDPSRTESSQAPKTIGICHIVDNTPGWPTGELRVPNMIEPAGSVENYYHQRTHIRLPNVEGRVTILQPPKYGTLKAVDGVVGGYEYLPSSPTHAGKDRASFLVEIGSYTVKAMYVFHVLTSGVGDRPEDITAICGPKGDMWTIVNGSQRP